MIRRIALAVLACAAAPAAGLCAEEQDASALGVIPVPKQVSLERGVYEFDEYSALLVSENATLGTRAAARAIQLGLRERFGINLPIIRIAEERKHGPRKVIWVIEPRALRPADEESNAGDPRSAAPRPRGPGEVGHPADRLTAPPRPPARSGTQPGPDEGVLHSPANTIGVKGLKFTDEMVVEGYFIRVDAMAIVVHGASDAGSYYGAQTLLQLVRPPREGGLFRRARGPTVPCLWMADWPSRRERVVPAEFPVPADPAAAERFMRTAARYKLNGIAKGAVPDAEATRERLRLVSQYCPVPCIDQVIRVDREAPLIRLALAAAAEGRSRLALAAYGEAAWGPPDPDPAELAARHAAAEAEKNPGTSSDTAPGPLSPGPSSGGPSPTAPDTSSSKDDAP